MLSRKLIPNTFVNNHYLTLLETASNAYFYENI
jgi:hypothetical protein